MLTLSEKVVRKIELAVVAPRRRARLGDNGITFLDPNYVIRRDLIDGRDGVVVDVGCASDPELAKHLMADAGVRAYGVDPTRKHTPALQELQDTSDGQFTHLPYALAAQPGTITFYEPLENESASLLAEHINAAGDDVTEYEVEAIDLPGLIERVGGARISFLKIDLEGAEYDLLAGIEAGDLDGVDQMFVEFHHHCTGYTRADTARLVERIESFGWTSVTLDRHNYLFVRPGAGSPAGDAS